MAVFGEHQDSITATREPYLSPDSASSTQVILLDDHDDGPLFDLWRLFAETPATPGRGGRDIVAKFIQRGRSRMLINETALIEAARRAVPHLDQQVVDFAGLASAEQLRAGRQTDLLIGVRTRGWPHAHHVLAAGGGCG
ncbi:hypothetical protein UVI_02057400 [Ustilaginoidea virens]|uniref:Uncharacterized protein n=1 Tax=Ustilaginoidea virens TaxID=1159556 RepID=A0A1B5L2H3_USTVR|nr:hypothetical protein UVI_02057400 [Ustilaginoidea virens]